MLQSIHHQPINETIAFVADSLQKYVMNFCCWKLPWRECFPSGHQVFDTCRFVMLFHSKEFWSSLINGLDIRYNYLGCSFRIIYLYPSREIEDTDVQHHFEFKAYCVSHVETGGVLMEYAKSSQIVLLTCREYVSFYHPCAWMSYFLAL